MARVVVIEPFCGGSHKQLLDVLCANVQGCERFTLPDNKWHWRARTSALIMSQIIPEKHQYRTLFCSSVLNLQELLALRPDLIKSNKIVYYHENQLAYPVQKSQERDYQFGYNQILTALVADEVVFNSRYNRDSFLYAISKHLHLIPKPRPDSDHITQRITQKSRVLHFPIQYPCRDGISQSDYVVTQQPSTDEHEKILHIVWPHRWEHDKDPETFFKCLYELHELKLRFKLSVIGQTYQEVPAIFEEAKCKLDDHIVHWGYQNTKADYYAVLRSAHVVVSTAVHEFFGVAMLEAVHLGCYPLCPNRLSYPEIFPGCCLYNTAAQLTKRLRYFCRNPNTVAAQMPAINTGQYSWESLAGEYKSLLDR